MVFEAEHINWNCPAGQRLDQLARLLPREPQLDITVFGSAPLQLFIDSTFVSDDVDLFPPEDSFIHLQGQVEMHRLAKDMTPLFISVSDHLAFKSTVDWRARAVEVGRHGHLFRIVHPWDVLVSKLQRLEEKDLAAFKLVLAKTGHPTEAELIRHLQKAVDLYRPKFDEEIARGDMMANTRLLWQEVWQKEIDVRASIIRPALIRMERKYMDFDPTLKDRLGKVRLPDKS
jgi:hypothetical protein